MAMRMVSGAAFKISYKSAQHRHLAVAARIGRVFQGGVVMGIAFGVVGADQGLIQQLPFLGLISGMSKLKKMCSC